MKIKVGVIYGGDTVEHEVSIITAVQAMNYMNTDNNMMLLLKNLEMIILSLWYKSI